MAVRSGRQSEAEPAEERLNVVPQCRACHPATAPRALPSARAPRALEQALGSAASTERQRRAFHNWFDAFRTLKFLHTMRDNGLESDDWGDARAGLESLLEHDQTAWTADDREVLRASLDEVPATSAA